jgi:VanZ family protein
MKKYIRFLPAAVFLIFVIVVIIIADTKGTGALQALAPGIPQSDKLGHFIIFGIMGLLVNISLQFKTMSVFNRQVLLGSVIVMAFAIGEEFTQILLPTRSFDFKDMACDLVGIVLFSSSFFRKLAIKVFQLRVSRSFK